jgi:hypothetical protein
MILQNSGILSHHYMVSQPRRLWLEFNGIYLTGRWIGSSTNLDMAEKKKIPDPAKNQTPVILPTSSHFKELVLPAAF